ncbi:MurR/RpiR family transcriptional regulator [Vagococcus penaei]|uniref:HTH rpiR-type domain-containing protein n=1 Tax=Vagococcus penaei TaxID=633807 RepID=A0A1Q2D596_9ENTE|nr:MurR/RpiR family transcriptional regulator [Vagococcus penaei]AQP53568.1 hypothetical protein BW732_04535 [Vagococcus penaei]
MSINKFGLLNALYEIVNSKEHDNDYAVASYLLDNIKRINEVSVNELVNCAFTTPSAIRRFCHRIGYDNFSELKVSFSHLIFPSNLRLRQFHPMSEYRVQRLDSIRRVIQDIEKNFTDTMVETIVSLIVSYKKVILVSANNTSSELIKFQQELLFAEKIVYVISKDYKENSMLEEIDDETLLLVSSVSGTFAAEASEWVRGLPSYNILLTGNRDPEFLESYHDCFYMSGQDIKNDVTGVYGKYGLTLIFDFISESFFYHS